MLVVDSRSLSVPGGRSSALQSGRHRLPWRPALTERFRRWRVCAERGLRGEQVAAWLYAEHLTLVYKDEPLPQHWVSDQPARRRLKTVTEARRVATPHRSPLPPLWAWGDEEWLPVLRLPDYALRQPRPALADQLPLLPWEVGGG